MASSLKEPGRSTWEDLHCLEVDSLDRVGRNSLRLVLGKSGKHEPVGGMCEAEPEFVMYAETKRHEVRC